MPGARLCGGVAEHADRVVSTLPLWQLYETHIIRSPRPTNERDLSVIRSVKEVKTIER